MFKLLGEGRANARAPETSPLVVQKEQPQRRICKSALSQEREFQKFPRFGPLYFAAEASILKGSKEEAWEHVIEKTGDDRLETTENYLSAIRDVEKEAIDCYADVAEVVSETEFRWMMLKDGCFQLQLAILILGGSSILEYPEDHIIFGRNQKNDIKRWLKSMFYVGNQIPLVVLWKLMEQPFFKRLLAAKEWEKPSDLLKRSLYEFVLFPCTGKRNSSWQVMIPTALQGLFRVRNPQLHKIQPSDLLHGLQSYVICTTENPIEETIEDIDLELGDGEDDTNDGKEFSSATSLRQSGIHFKNVQGIKNRGIYFKPRTFCAVLSMPTFRVDDETLLVFEYLKHYERAQQPKRRNKREVCAYLKFMSELVRTKDDVKLLDDKGIIKADPAHKENLPAILRRLAEGESSQNLRHLRLQINEYSRPSWWKYKEILSIAFVFTMVQTVLATLSYLHDLKS